MLPLASARTVFDALLGRDAGRRARAGTSTDTVKAVPSGASLAATIGSRRSRRASAAVSGAQTMPQVWRMMKAIFSGVQSDGGDDQVALVLAVVVVGDDDDLAAREGLDRLGDAMAGIRPLLVIMRPIVPNVASS